MRRVATLTLVLAGAFGLVSAPTAMSSVPQGHVIAGGCGNCW